MIWIRKLKTYNNPTVVKVYVLSDNRRILRKKQMYTKNVTLTAEQIGIILQTFHEQIVEGRIDPSDRELADEVIDILEDAENRIYTEVSDEMDITTYQPEKG